MHISPTIGRVVWFWPAHREELQSPDQPLAAMVTYVHSDTMVNLVVFSPNGSGAGRTSVPLWQDDETSPRPESFFCEWMPYQKGQAAKNG